RKLLAELEPTRRYQPSSTDGAGVRSGGPYHWRAPREFYTIKDDYFKTETGSVSIPTLESIEGMMPKKDWNSINDDWAEHDFARGNSGSQTYPAVIAARYGALLNLPDFVRKGQLANYEAFRAMYEGRNALMFHPTTAVITWMSNPAQPSFVWQIYHYDLEPMSSYFAVMHASEMEHIQFNQATEHVQIINNLPTPMPDVTAHIAVYNLDGALVYENTIKTTAPPEAATDLGAIAFPNTASQVHFLKLDLTGADGEPISTNFYWRALPDHPDDYQALNTLPQVTLQATATQQDNDGTRTLTVTVHNPSASIALMAHMQLRRKTSGARVLPVDYSDNYISLVPGETRTITVRAAVGDFKGEDSLVVFDGWNVSVAPSDADGVSIAPNLDAQPSTWPDTGLPYQTVGLR
ncbi:MAG TPA: glycoside hydrolase family 2, partial [Terracidiphilus sp.]|nr:glycoside hydrolase family 2 [Terracidiphilus sp.]